VVEECTLPVDPVLHAVAYAAPPGLFIANAAYRLRLWVGLPNTAHASRAAAKRNMPIFWPLIQDLYPQLFAPQTIPGAPWSCPENLEAIALSVLEFLADRHEYMHTHTHTPPYICRSMRFRPISRLCTVTHGCVRHCYILLRRFQLSPLIHSLASATLFYLSAAAVFSSLVPGLLTLSSITTDYPLCRADAALQILLQFANSLFAAVCRRIQALSLTIFSTTTKMCAFDTLCSLTRRVSFFFLCFLVSCFFEAAVYANKGVYKNS